MSKASRKGGEQGKSSIHKEAMSRDSSVSIDALFAGVVSKLAAVDEPWAGLTYLAGGGDGGSTRPTPAEMPAAADHALEHVRALSDAVERAGLISSNEALDEVPTRCLKYLLVSYLAARALLAWHGEQDERLGKLREARGELMAFLTVVDRFGMLSEQERDRVLDDTPEAVMTPTQVREDKIARFKAEKEAERKMRVLMERASTRGLEDDDEEGERDAALTILQSAVRRALDGLSSLDQEMEILRYGARQRARGVDPREKATRARPKGPPPGMGGLPASFRIVSEREKVREGVFRPSHSLPTYTVEEWGEIEMQRAVQAEQEKRDAEIVKARRAAEEDSDGDEAANRETMEKRDWDNWRDSINKGSGNTMR